MSQENFSLRFLLFDKNVDSRSCEVLFVSTWWMEAAFFSLPPQQETFSPWAGKCSSVFTSWSPAEFYLCTLNHWESSMYVTLTQPLTFVHRVDGDEEALCWSLVIQVAEGEAEAVVTFEPGGVGDGAVFVPQTVHLHVVLSEVLTGRQLSPTRLCLQTSHTAQNCCSRWWIITCRFYNSTQYELQWTIILLI